MSFGGMGIRGAEDHAPVAYAASVLAAQPLLQSLLGGDLQPSDEDPPLFLLAAISTTIGEEAREEEMVGVPQKVLSLQVDMERRRRLMEGLGEEEVPPAQRRAGRSRHELWQWRGKNFPPPPPQEPPARGGRGGQAWACQGGPLPDPW